MGIIEGTLCRLRPIQRADAAISISWRNNVQIRNTVFGFPFPVTEEMEAVWYDRVLSDREGKRASFGVECRGEKLLIGLVHLFGINWPWRTVEFGIVLGNADYHGRGIGSEATSLAINYAFNELNLDRVELRVSETNLAARHIYRKCGFAEEGRLRRAAYIDGNSIDIIVMGLLRDDFVAV